jgi:hypothetical protein
MAQRLGRSEATVNRASKHVHRQAGRAVEVDLKAQQAGQVYVDVFGHGRDCERVGRKFDDRHDWVADDVALPGGEEMHRRSSSALPNQRDSSLQQFASTPDKR